MRCRAPTCEAELTWAEGPSGTSIPLVRITVEQWRALPRRETLYRIEMSDSVPARALAVVLPEPERMAATTDTYLNHFITCASREQFRRRR